MIMAKMRAAMKKRNSIKWMISHGQIRIRFLAPEAHIRRVSEMIRTTLIVMGMAR
jgi:hypothetical protein